MDSKKHSNHFVTTFITCVLLASGGVSTAQATDSGAVDKNLIPANCSELYTVLENRPFTIPSGSWFWKEARSYLAGVGLPNDSLHVKMFEEAFEAEYPKIGDTNFNHRVAYDMTPIFQKPGLGDVAYDYCSRS